MRFLHGKKHTDNKKDIMVHLNQNKTCKIPSSYSFIINTPLNGHLTVIISSLIQRTFFVLFLKTHVS